MEEAPDTKDSLVLDYDEFSKTLPPLRTITADEVDDTRVVLGMDKNGPVYWDMDKHPHIYAYEEKWNSGLYMFARSVVTQMTDHPSTYEVVGANTGDQHSSNLPSLISFVLETMEGRHTEMTSLPEPEGYLDSLKHLVLVVEDGDSIDPSSDGTVRNAIDDILRSGPSVKVHLLTLSRDSKLDSLTKETEHNIILSFGQSSTDTSRKLFNTPLSSSVVEPEEGRGWISFNDNPHHPRVFQTHSLGE